MSDHELSEALRRAGFQVAELRPILPTLEDVFVTLTQEAAAANNGGRS